MNQVEERGHGSGLDFKNQTLTQSICHQVSRQVFGQLKGFGLTKRGRHLTVSKI